MIDGKWEEQFIQINLSQLDKFEFDISELRTDKQTLIDLKLALASFQTSFSIEHKKWFVAYDYVYTVIKSHILSFFLFKTKFYMSYYYTTK